MRVEMILCRQGRIATIMPDVALIRIDDAESHMRQKWTTRRQADGLINGLYGGGLLLDRKCHGGRAAQKQACAKRQPCA